VAPHEFVTSDIAELAGDLPSARLQHVCAVERGYIGCDEQIVIVQQGVLSPQDVGNLGQSPRRAACESNSRAD
jgi:hypothetical protein